MKEASGHIKESLGALTGNKRMEAQGRKDQKAGAARRKKGPGKIALRGGLTAVKLWWLSGASTEKMEDLIFSVTSYFDASRVGDLSETGSKRAVMITDEILRRLP